MSPRERARGESEHTGLWVRYEPRGQCGNGGYSEGVSEQSEGTSERRGKEGETGRSERSERREGTYGRGP